MPPPPALLAAVLAAAAGLAAGPALAALAFRSLRTPRHADRLLAGAVSATTGLLFALVVLRFGADPRVVGELVFVAAGVTLSVVDLAEQRLPNALVLPAAVAVPVLLVAAALIRADPAAAIGSVAGAAALFAVFLLLAVVSRGQVGMGDVKFGLVAGAATGALGLHAWLVGLIAAVLLNGGAAVVALLARRTTLRGSVPFGPSIFVGALIAVLVPL